MNPFDEASWHLSVRTDLMLLFLPEKKSSCDYNHIKRLTKARHIDLSSLRMTRVDIRHSPEHANRFYAPASFRKNKALLNTSRDSRKLVTPTCPRRKWTGAMMLHGPGTTVTSTSKRIWRSCVFFRKQTSLFWSRHSRKLVTSTCLRSKWTGSMMPHGPGIHSPGHANGFDARDSFRRNKVH